MTDAFGAAFLIASSTVVPSVGRPVEPCHEIVQPPHCMPRSSAARPATRMLETVGREWKDVSAIDQQNL